MLLWVPPRAFFVMQVSPQVHLKIAPATETLQKLVDNNEAGTFDFAFIDADKVLVNYRLWLRWHFILDNKHVNYQVEFYKWILTLIATNLSVIVAPVGLRPILGNRISNYGIFSKTTTTTMSWVWPCWEREASLQLTMCSGEGLWWDHLDA